VKIYSIPQGSPEWHAARAGVVTASNFTLARDRTAKGARTAKANDYAFRLALESISGAPLEEPQFTPWQARRGQLLEPVAARMYELQTGNRIASVGFITSDCGRFGASPDGLIGEQKGVEFKAFLNAEKIKGIILSGSIAECMDQVQGGMWLTGRTTWDFGLLCPALASIGKAFTLHAIERDDDYIKQMEADLINFHGYVESIIADLRQDAGPDQRELVASLMPAPPERPAGGIDPNSIKLF
jgi:hypothetical protein